MTFATLLVLIANSVWFAAALFEDGSTNGIYESGLRKDVWVIVSALGGIVLCGLVVVYLRDLFRSPKAPDNKVVWTVLILVLGPFAMAYYWSAFLRRVTHEPL